MAEKAVSIQIRGAIQGVGFRPCIHKLAEQCSVHGYVQNTASGVTVYAEGAGEAVTRFVRLLPEKAPALAVIEQMSLTENVPLEHCPDFSIRPSMPGLQKDTLVLPDIAICPECAAELKDPADRRFRYPFINCTNCGPRFTIIKEVPYDRASTTMAVFPMCGPCAEEYGNLRSRRYHAQPDCCPDCGPQIRWLNAAGCGEAEQKNPDFTADPLKQAAECIRGGGIVAVKSIGGFHLACDAYRPEAVRSLRRRKHRDERPFAVMCADMTAVREICEVSEDEERLLTGPRAPIVLLKKKNPADFCDISENSELGVMLPYTPLHILLLEEGFRMLVMTSGNLSHQPIVYRNKEAMDRLGGIADGFLLHNRDIFSPCDDSLCRFYDGAEYFIRRSRGYAPQPVSVKRELGCMLACGAEQKASFALAKGTHVFQSQHIGDLKNWETLKNYEEQIGRFRRLFDIRPEAIVCDLHPDFLSAEYAEKQSREAEIPLIRVQHHHAHMASCMLDNDLDEPAIGLVWDGTGYGYDGTIWGAECLTGGFEAVERFGTIRPIPLIGGDLAVEDVRRIACVLLREAGETESSFPEAARWENLLRNGIHCPVSTGMGRLFDGVSALIGITELSSYEGQAAIRLENAANAWRKNNPGGESCGRSYPLAWEADRYGADLSFDWRPMVRSLVIEKRDGASSGELAAVFLNTLAAMAAELCRRAGQKTGIRTVVLSGGTFQNMYLMKRLPETLRKEGFAVYHHRRFSTNDEGIAAGQLAVAAAQLRKG